MKLYVWLMLVLSPALSAQSSFYQCEVAGVVTFSQFPCDKSAQGQQEQTLAAPSDKEDFRSQQKAVLQKRQRFFDYQLQRLDADYQRESERLTAVLRVQNKLVGGQELLQQTQLQLQELQKEYQRQLVMLESQRAELELQLEQLEHGSSN